VVLLSLADDGSPGLREFMDHANAVLAEMADEGTNWCSPMSISRALGLKDSGTQLERKFGVFPTLDERIGDSALVEDSEAPQTHIAGLNSVCWYPT